MNALQPLGSRPAVVQLATGENRILVNGFESGFAMLDSRDSNLESNPAHPYPVVFLRVLFFHLLCFFSL